MQLANAIELAHARQDRAARFAPPSRGHQIAFAMVDAAVKNQGHVLAASVGRTVDQIERQQTNRKF